MSWKAINRLRITDMYDTNEWIPYSKHKGLKNSKDIKRILKYCLAVNADN